VTEASRLDGDAAAARTAGRAADASRLRLLAGVLRDLGG
jgi:hypothetical protein